MVVEQYRSTLRRGTRDKSDEETLTMAIGRLATQYGRYRYRRIAVPTTDRSSAPGRYRSGSQGSARVLRSSSRAVRGRTEPPHRHREGARRTTSLGDFLHTQGGTYPDRAMETALQRSASPQCAESPASGSRNECITGYRSMMTTGGLLHFYD
jgi:hypothetical protein